MKKFLLAGLFFSGVATLSAQHNCGTRYLNKIFTNVTKTTVTYSTANSATLVMDVFQPTGDTVTNRPVVILAHGGSFVGGDRTESVVTELCNNYAKRGYVTASIEYRLGSFAQMFQYNTAVDVVMKAISDGKAAVRWFRKDAANGNTYHVNPNIIFFGGNSAGAVLGMHLAYIDDLSECPTNMQPIITNNGGLEGNSGNDGYPSTVAAVINLAGGLHATSMIGTSEEPVVSFQGDADNTVPYNCANAQGGATPVQLCGLGAMEPVLTANGINHVSRVYPGQGHCPWQSNATMMAEIDSTTTEFMYQLMCSGSIGIAENSISKLNILPNPVKDVLVIENETPIQSVVIYNTIGQAVFSWKNINDKQAIIGSLGNYPKGIYTIQATLSNGKSAVSKFVKE